MRAIIILRQSDKDVKYVVFQRLNTGGAQLNHQEIRNSTFPGPFNNLILELSVYRKFHALLGIKNRDKSAIYKEMRDAELVLRYFTFRETWQSFSGGVKQQLDSYIDKNAKEELLRIERALSQPTKTKCTKGGTRVTGRCYSSYGCRI